MIDSIAGKIVLVRKNNPRHKVCQLRRNGHVPQKQDIFYFRHNIDKCLILSVVNVRLNGDGLKLIDSFFVYAEYSFSQSTCFRLGQNLSSKV
jgi:hypothetical protein